MRQALLCLLYWSYIELSAPLPIEEKPGFTPWPLGKRTQRVLDTLEFSGVRQVALGTSEKAQFGIPDPTCRGVLPGAKCWDMDQFTVDKMIDAREPKANHCSKPCLFYTAGLSGAAEREANFVLKNYLLTGATEERKYQTIWDLHDPLYYPNKDELDKTPETKCLFLDVDKRDPDVGHNGCQRLYFMSMSKAMAAECSGEVFVMTTSELHKDRDVPVKGIWWEVEFPTLIDERRAEDKKITKITYLEVEPVTEEEFKRLQNDSEENKSAPPVKYRGEYWPTGPGKNQLERSKVPNVIGRASQQKNNLTNSGDQENSQQGRGVSNIGFVKRGTEDSGDEVCVYGEDCYPYPYPIDKMYEWYKDATY